MPVAPPRPKGPHLNALRAFEAAARLGSFTAAAEELCVTPGAITQHVKALEAWANAPLFTRGARGVQPTALALDLLPGFSAAFDQLGAAVHRLRAGAAPEQIAIATLPSVAQLWLPRRLEALRHALPDLSVSVTALEQPPNLTREQFDLSVFFCEGPPPAGAMVLRKGRIFPVCAPQVAASLTTPADLAQVTLLHDATWTDDWDLWLSAQGLGPAAAIRGQSYSLFAVALEEARRGAGVLMSHETLVEALLDSGDLIRPFPQSVAPDRHLVLDPAPDFTRRSVFADIRTRFLAEQPFS